jgi:hypothetical protein
MAWVALFAIAFALVEASVVVYLRSLYYPGGFAFPLRLVEVSHLRVELARELATLLMLGSVGVLAGTKRWERFGYFLVAFGIWDIFYYIWLRVFLGWPASPADWDVLFLLPLPWIGPVIAPVAISAVMIAIGTSIILRINAGLAFRPGPASWGVALAGTAVLLYSFMSDTGATLGARMPEPYAYWQLVVGLLLYAFGYALAVKASDRIGR